MNLTYRVFFFLLWLPFESVADLVELLDAVEDIARVVKEAADTLPVSFWWLGSTIVVLFTPLYKLADGEKPVGLLTILETFGEVEAEVECCWDDGASE